MVNTSISELLKRGIDHLGEGDYLNPLLDAQVLLSFLLKKDKIYLHVHGNEILDEDTVGEYMKLIDLRKKRYPLQYIVGTQEFMGLDFKVCEGVLIPRPDTEVLVEKIIDIVNSEERFNRKNPIKIVDIGTGSGAITISLAYYIKNSEIYSVDINPRAIDIASQNAKNLSVEKNIQFLNGSLLEPLYENDLKGKIDIIASNPPYIPTKVIENLQTEVSTYEPKLALDGGVDGLDFYRKIIDGASDFLTYEGLIAFEIGHDQGEDVSKILEGSNEFKNIEIITDLSGLDRVVIGRKN